MDLINGVRKKFDQNQFEFSKHAGRPLHIQCSYPIRTLVKVVTVYEPDPDEWIDFKVRVT